MYSDGLRREILSECDSLLRQMKDTFVLISAFLIQYRKICQKSHICRFIVHLSVDTKTELESTGRHEHVKRAVPNIKLSNFMELDPSPKVNIYFRIQDILISCMEDESS
jgi:hypothetical protein